MFGILKTLNLILTELREVSKLLKELPEVLPSRALAYLSSNQSKAPLQRYFAWNHRWVAMLEERNRRTASDTYDLIEQQFGDALFHLDQFKALEEFATQVSERGDLICDFGVYKGSSTRSLAALFPSHEIHGFDSFEGLPSRWSHALTGDFGDVAGVLPKVPENVKLFPGWFSDSLPLWLETFQARPVALWRIDCDIYDSTKDIFDSLEGKIGSGDFVLFDELIGYRGWRHHEYKALEEYCSARGLEPEYLAYGLTYVLLRFK